MLHLAVCSTSYSIGLSNDTFGEKGLIATSYLDIYQTPNKARLNHTISWAAAFLGKMPRPNEEFVQITFINGAFLVESLAIQGSPLEDWRVTKFRTATSSDGEHYLISTQVKKKTVNIYNSCLSQVAEENG